MLQLERIRQKLTSLTANKPANKLASRIIQEGENAASVEGLAHFVRECKPYCEEKQEYCKGMQKCKHTKLLQHCRERAQNCGQEYAKLLSVNAEVLRRNANIILRERERFLKYPIAQFQNS